MEKLVAVKGGLCVNRGAVNVIDYSPLRAQRLSTQAYYFAAVCNFSTQVCGARKDGQWQSSSRSEQVDWLGGR